MIGDQDTTSKEGKTYLLLIGIDAYSHGFPALNNARRDTVTIGSLLQTRFQFEPELTTALYDDQATGHRILETLSGYRTQIGPQDSLVVYFAGHGWYDVHSQVGYWLPADAKKNQVNTFISFSVLRDHLKAIPSFHTLILADSCFAGTLFMERDIMAKEIAFERLAQYPSRYLLAAGRNEPVSDGPPGTHSPFAKSLLSILNHQQESLLPASELTLLLIEGVGANARQLPRGEPIRDVGHQGGVFLFRLKGHAAPVPEPIPDDEAPVRSIITETPTTFTSLRAFQKAALKHIAAGDLKKAFLLFDDFMSIDSYLFNDSIHLQSRYNDLSEESQKGLVVKEEERVERNRIYDSAIKFVQKLEPRDVELG